MLNMDTTVTGIIGSKDEILDSLIKESILSKAKKLKDLYKEKRPIYIDKSKIPVDCFIYERNDLYPGIEINEPSVIEEMDSTIFIPPDCSAVVDNYMNIIINLK